MIATSPALRPFVYAIVGVVALGTATVMAQRRGGFGGGFGGRNRREVIRPNTPYDGRFTFVRVRYGPDYGYVSQGLPWSHDYPAGEQHFMKILDELSYIHPHTEETNILTFDDPQLFRYPVAYLCEPGGWTMSDQEAASLRTYLQKGGFMIVDDFRMQHWGNFESQIMRVLPEARIYDLDIAHPIFHAFFEIKTLDVPQYYDPPPPIFRAIYEGNDPSKRIMVMINYNTDISEFWEWSDTGLKPIDESNEAYKLGVNYVIYGMTHYGSGGSGGSGRWGSVRSDGQVSRAGRNRSRLTTGPTRPARPTRPAASGAVTERTTWNSTPWNSNRRTISRSRTR